MFGAARPGVSRERGGSGGGKPWTGTPLSCAVSRGSPGGGLGGAPRPCGPRSPAPVPAPPPRPSQRRFPQPGAEEIPVPAPRPALRRIQSLTSCWQPVPFPLRRLSEHRVSPSPGRCHRVTAVSPRCARRGPGTLPACCSLARVRHSQVALETEGRAQN